LLDALEINPQTGLLSESRFDRFIQSEVGRLLANFTFGSRNGTHGVLGVNLIGQIGLLQAGENFDLIFLSCVFSPVSNV
jgi:hypothetical protein